MASDSSPETHSKETRAVKTLRKARGDSSIVGGTRDFLHFLLDYNIVAFTVSFIVARAAYDAISAGVSNGLSFLFQSVGTRIRNIGEFGRALVILVVVLMICFLFIQYVFQPVIASKTITEERRLREIVKTVEEKKLEDEVNNHTGLSFLGSPMGDTF